MAGALRKAIRVYAPHRAGEDFTVSVEACVMTRTVPPTLTRIDLRNRIRGNRDTDYIGAIGGLPGRTGGCRARPPAKAGAPAVPKLRQDPIFSSYWG